MATYMYLWHMGEAGGRQVKEKLGIQAILHQNSRFQGDPSKIVINWGSSNPPFEVLKCRVINPPNAVHRSVNKRIWFRYLNGKVNHVPFTEDANVALTWLLEGYKVVCRDRLEGREGAGIRIIDATALNLTVRTDSQSPWGWVANLISGRVRPNLRPLEGVRLFTKFVPSEREYRVHVVDGQAICVHRKVSGTDETIRNTSNGWHFRRVTSYPSQLIQPAIDTVRELGLDFAAVDMLWDGNQAWVLETNTSPGIDGMTQTVLDYANALGALVTKVERELNS